ncbi:MAG: Unknown protein [uncultured Campylobacterales bacterium]|uniref:Lipoprotein n=1 Tax=uncultured Campylobacterales bacterium TaxID=352960 RepID=A0A6S6SNT0_9BACT|nr:MAG: Unknown protein [uncultured Campylobacterales bacterium]
MKKIALLILGFIILQGCGSNNPSLIWNKAQIEKKSPLRLLPKNTNGKLKYTQEWAGVKGNTFMNDRYLDQTFSGIQKMCGYGKNEFIEHRVVKHQNNLWEEVWLFKDMKSNRDDKTSGLTVLLEYNSSTNVTLTKFFGDCHTGKGVTFNISD